MNVLIVEDEKEVSRIVKDLVEESSGAEVTIVDNGLDGFLAAQKRKYNLIITDHEMPFMKGAAMVVAIRTKENLNQGTSIIMLSAYINKELRSQLGLTNIEFVDKPFNNSDLLQVISPYLI
jgi:CheY-like chemotaxis protein